MLKKKAQKPFCTYMPPPTIAGSEQMFWGCPAGRPLSNNTYFTWRDFSSVTGKIPKKLATNVHHVGEYCRKDFQGHVVKVTVTQWRPWKSCELDSSSTAEWMVERKLTQILYTWETNWLSRGGLNTDRNLYLSKLDRFYFLGGHLTRFLFLLLGRVKLHRF